MKNVVCLILLAFGQTNVALADEKFHRETAEKLLMVFRFDSIAEQMRAQALDELRQTYVEVTKDKREMDKVANKYYQRLEKMPNALPTWEKTKKALLPLWMKNYSEPETIAILKFYQSTAGGKLLVTHSKLMQQSQKLFQQDSEVLLAQTRRVVIQMRKELKAKNEN